VAYKYIHDTEDKLSVKTDSNLWDYRIITKGLIFAFGTFNLRVHTAIAYSVPFGIL